MSINYLPRYWHFIFSSAILTPNSAKITAYSFLALLASSEVPTLGRIYFFDCSFANESGILIMQECKI